MAEKPKTPEQPKTEPNKKVFKHSTSMPKVMKALRDR
jgi:hypothetical protein